MYSVYVLQNDFDKSKYIGFTSNLKNRIEQHNNGSNVSTKRNKGKWILIYAEAFRNKEDAMQREIKLKHLGRSKQELFKRISKSFLN